MKNKSNINNPPQSDGFSPVASSGDFTGLIPVGIDSNEELEAYNQMYAFLPSSEVEAKNIKNIGK
ncbi:MAG: hypothetical protein ACI4WH_07830 [Oscillospiraceae bacterium]